MTDGPERPARSSPPTSTYRLQLTPDFTLVDAAAVVDYLADLGVSHVYCSPILQATPGSTHGYDVVDHRRVSTDLGGPAGLAALAHACRTHGLGLVVDIVPNHMHVPNPKWDDVVDRGRESPFAAWFDIDWDAPELTYRRFFDIGDLAGVRVEDPGVYAATHALVLRLVRRDVVQGLRIDHPDGLADPRGYLDRLAADTGGAWTVVEKILEADETMPNWACAGTTGYDSLHAVQGIFVDPAGEPELTRAYGELTGAPTDWHAVADEAKRSAIRSLAPEVDRLTRLVARSLSTVPHERIAAALTELLVAMPVYRAYVDPGRPAPTETRRIIDDATAHACAREPDLAETIGAIAALVVEGPPEVVVRFQQTTGPVMAKGVEDTAFYRYHRLAALCEVGGDPGRFGWDTEEFHAHAGRIARDWPATMTTLSTHDTKRSEDMRARLVALSEIPDVWQAAVAKWMGRAPDSNTDYLFWQTLVGAWPLSRDRAAAYLTKATREAKQHTAWVDGDPDYDAALSRFVNEVYADTSLLSDVERFVEQLRPAALANSLGQKLIALTMPGVPDVYQGSESEFLALVDPDNRRPVDFTRLRRGLSETPDPKHRLVAAALRLRRGRPEAFGPDGSYAPLHATGPAAAHLVGFVRGGAAVTLATRLSARLAAGGGWHDTTLELPSGRWTDVLGRWSGQGRVRLVELLDPGPVALLTVADDTSGR